jgi:DNA-directed RNA polymerase specialized sigma24 family protein
VTIFEGRPDLLYDFRAGVREALGRVYSFYFNDVFRLVSRGFTLSGPPPVTVSGLTDPSAQQDAVQDVFVRAFSESARLSYDGIRPYRPYLLRIARNYRIDQERKQRRERLARDPELEVPEAADQQGPYPACPPMSQEDALDFARRRRATLSFLETADDETRA